jgi:hypothetical protein
MLHTFITVLEKAVKVCCIFLEHGLGPFQRRFMLVEIDESNNGFDKVSEQLARLP